MGNNAGNLIPNSQRTPEELREMTRKGGIRSGQVRRAKKSFAEAARWALEMEASADINGQEEKISQYQAIILKLLEVSMDTSNKQWIQAAQMLINIQNGEANINKIKAETENIRAKTKLLRSGEESRNGLLESLIGDLKDDIHGKATAADEKVAAE